MSEKKPDKRPPPAAAESFDDGDGEPVKPDMSKLTDVPRRVSFPEEEQRVLRYWEEIDAFKTALKQSEGKKPFSFYDGPPFATGLPHYGHLLAGTIKDVVTRFAHQTGHFVERRFGWDCHGLPIEYAIEKELGLKTKDDVLAYGIANYNKACRGIVMRYAKEWEHIVGRLGRWIDFQNDYKTMNLPFMESVWWVFGQLFAKKLVYKGFKVMPYSTACTTSLSNFEVQQNYRMTTDPSITVNFPVVDDPDGALFLAWTTTPWTLPSNLALCVRADMVYVKFRDVASGKVYYAAKSRLPFIYPVLNSKKKKKGPSPFELLSECTGKDLVGKSYVPLFPYFVGQFEGQFKVVCDNYVTDESGTGIVHQAPAFGEDDYRVCMANGICVKGGSICCPVDANGRFVAPVNEFLGMHVKDADTHIIAHLKEKGRVLKVESVSHSYPFCWRSDTPLIYKAVPSWFVRVAGMTDRLLKNNAATYWVPDFVKQKRFHNWLEGARDWAISRTRYWGCPIPIWMSDDGEEVVCVGSVEELERLTGVKVTDLHREHVDGLTIPSKQGKGYLHRIPDVFDCWFESGSMPYAQQHYPFENKTKFEGSFPADFIAEGIDQTRGWFYTLLVLGTALFDTAPFKNLIVNGMVLAEDGKKMSKRHKNYPDPMKVMTELGADALRLYLVNSPVVRGDDLKFSEKGVNEVVKTIFLPWFNAYRFFVQNAKRYEVAYDGLFSSSEAHAVRSDNVMDKWIVSASQSLVKFVKEEMEAYRLYTVMPKLLRFVDALCNWYVRLNRRRLKGEDGQEEWKVALCTLFRVLYAAVRTMAPFTPFLTENMYQNLKKFVPEAERQASVHFLMFPEFEASLVNLEIEAAVNKMREIVVAGRKVRDQKKIGMKFPVPRYVVLSLRPDYFEGLDALLPYVLEELNTKKVELSSETEKFYRFAASTNDRRLGKRLRRKMRPVKAALKVLGHEQILSFLETGKLVVCEETLDSEDVSLSATFVGDAAVFHASELGTPTEYLMLEYDVPPEMMLEGFVRVLVSKVQQLRKTVDMVVEDKVDVHFLFHADCDEKKAAEMYPELLAKALRPTMTCEVLKKREDLKSEPCVAQKVKGDKEEDLYTIYFTKPDGQC